MIVEPKLLNFGQVSRLQEVAPKKAVLTKGDGGPISPKLKPFEQTGIEADLKEIKPGETYELEVKLAEEFDGKLGRADLELETGVAEAPVIKFQVFARWLPRLVAKPRYFSLPMQPSVDTELRVNLEWDDKKPHKVENLSVDDPDLQVRLEENDGQQEVVLVVPAGYRPLTNRRTILMETDDPTVKKFQIQAIAKRDYKPLRAAPTTPPKPVVTKGETEPAAIRAKAEAVETGSTAKTATLEAKGIEKTSIKEVAKRKRKDTSDPEEQPSESKEEATKAKGKP
ncbi:MAG: hypothetical protein JSV78_14980 [Phycisphaerales bacterium]|nr:MAG: hypothetical protein JSV78_14980 [Phycisphaerales bacterium]